jgi:hypothetical protein
MEAKTFFTFIRELAIALVIAVLLPMIAYWTAAIIKEEPKYPTRKTHRYLIEREETLTKQYNHLTRLEKSLERSKKPEASEKLTQVLKELDQVETEREAVQDDLKKVSQDDINRFNDESRKYQTLFLYTTLPWALICLLLGLLIPMASLGTGFLLGGIGTLIMAYGVSWSIFNPLFKLFSLIIAFLIVVGVSFWFYQEHRVKS